MSCVFCAIARGASSAYVVLETDDIVAFLDHRPVFLGHSLVVPREHHEMLADLPDPLKAPFLDAVQALSWAVPAGMGGEGSFVAINNRVSQSVPHLHAHVVPRTRGDGLRGFLWPRHRHDAAAMDEARDRIRAALKKGKR